VVVLDAAALVVAGIPVHTGPVCSGNSPVEETLAAPRTTGFA
jgi:hypothetical protein